MSVPRLNGIRAQQQAFSALFAFTDTRFNLAVGVMPASFFGVEVGRRFDVALPL